MAQYPFSNFKVHVVGYGAGAISFHENAKNRVVSDTILTYQKNFLLPISEEVTKKIHIANVEGGATPTFQNEELGEFLEFGGVVLTDIGGKTTTEGDAFFNLVKT